MSPRCNEPSPGATELPSARRWANRLVIAVLFSAVVGGAFYLSRPKRPRPAGLNQLVHDLTGTLPWYYTVVQQYETQARTSGRHSWIPHFLSIKAMEQDMRIWKKSSDAQNELMSRHARAWPAIPDLLSAVQMGGPGSRTSAQRVSLIAAETLGRIDADKSPAFEKLKPRLANDERAARTFRWLLIGKNQFGRPFDPAVRRFALAGLAATGSSARIALTNLIDIAESGETEEHEFRALAFAAMNGLGEIAKPAVPILKQAIQNRGEWPDVRAVAVQSLVEIAPGDADLPALLREHLSDNSAFLVRVEAAGALRKLNAPVEELLPVLTNGLNHKLVVVRRTSLRVLGEMGTSAHSARVPVTRLLEDSNASVRSAAQETLRRIGAETEH